jgi:Ca2+-binding EF-hand superfamily protein
MIFRERELLKYFRKCLSNRGVYGIVGIGRQFRIMDANMDGTISMPEF